MAVEVISFGCRLNATEGETVRREAEAAAEARRVAQQAEAEATRIRTVSDSGPLTCPVNSNRLNRP